VNRRALMVAVIVTATGGNLYAQAPAAPRALTLDQALDMARKRNRNLTVERARLAQVATSIEQAWSVLLPTIAAQGRYTRNNIAFAFPVSASKTLTIQPLNQLDGSVSATMPLLVPAAYSGLEAVKTNVSSSEANFEASEAQVLFSVAQAFYAAAGADEILLARSSSVEVARATLVNAQTRFSAGTVTKVDVDRAELALLRAQQAERETINAREQTYRGLATLIQTQEPFKVVPPPLPPVTAREESVDAALHLRPEFRALELATQSSDAESRAYGWRWSPSLSAFGNGRIFNYDNFAAQHHAWAVGAQLDWVLFDGGTRDAQRHLAAAQAREAEARAAVLRDSISDDLANGNGQLKTKRSAQQAAERSVGLARETLDLVRTQYEAGSATQIDLLSAQDNLVGAQEALAQAHLDVAVADLTLRRAAGTFPGK
jgi:outer membrane protein TolC